MITKFSDGLGRSAFNSMTCCLAGSLEIPQELTLYGGQASVLDPVNNRSLKDDNQVGLHTKRLFIDQIKQSWLGFYP